MTLQNKLSALASALGAFEVNVYHYWHSKMTAPYIVWAEDGEDRALHANNRKGEQSIGGTIDYFTKTEFDPVVDDIQTVLNSFDFAFGWKLNSVIYEEETNLIHWSWDFVI